MIVQPHWTIKPRTWIALFLIALIVWTCIIASIVFVFRHI